MPTENTLVQWYWDNSWKNPTLDDPGDTDLKYAKVGNEWFLTISTERRMVFTALLTPPSDPYFLSSSYIELGKVRMIHA